MLYLQLIAVCVVLISCASGPKKDLAQDPVLKPYVEQLKESTSPQDLQKIRGMAKSELVLLLHGYGTGIRNEWIHHDRDSRLASFFRTHGISDPEGESMVIIEALWYDLNSHLTPSERKAIDARGKLVARKRITYEKLESECARQLTKARGEFEDCYRRHGLPSPQNPATRDPFSQILIGKSGHIQEILFFDGASPELKHCLGEILNNFTFASFDDGDEFVTLYIIEFPHFCRVAERDSLYDGMRFW